MKRRSKSGLAQDLFSLAAVLPWWAGVVMAVAAYAVLHHYATAEVASSATPGQMGQMVVGQMIKALATFG